MASIFKRKNKDGTSCWRAVVRIKGYPTVCNHFDRKQEADDWAADIERQIKHGQYKLERNNIQRTFADLLERYIDSGSLGHQKSVEDTLRHLNYWKKRFKSYALVHLTAELIGKERRLLQDTPTNKGQTRSPATVNRYLASLSAILTYATRELRWIGDNPCFNLVKLKESSGRDRVLSDEEITCLLTASRKSDSPYLYCVILLSLTTGARQGEILGLEWKHVDLDNRLAYLQETKNGRPRSIALSDAVIEELRTLEARRDPLKTLVFASKTAFGRTDLKKVWKKALEQAGIMDFRAHDMRHTFATLAARQGASNLELATAMGHRSLDMIQRYTHLDVEVTRNSAIISPSKFSKESLHDIL